MNEIFMAVAQGQIDTSSPDKILIYKWLGKHFDEVQSIVGYKSRKLIAFRIGHIQFLAVANYKDESG